MPDLPGFTTFLLYLFFVVLTFLVFREIVCWYWKINKGLELLTEIRDLLRQSVSMAASQASVPPAPRPPAPAAPEPEVSVARCPACATALPVGADRCPRCGLGAARAGARDV